MFIESVEINNFRIFDWEFSIDWLQVPDWNKWSWINIFVWENGCGKTTVLEAIWLCLLEYKTDNISINDFNDHSKNLNIRLLSNQNFTVSKSMSWNFECQWFNFIAKKRARKNKKYLSSIITKDQYFVPVTWVKWEPKAWSPDLRLAVNNPFKWNRFSETDIITIDSNRTNQTRSWTFNNTRFDRLMEDFSYQFLNKYNPKQPDLNYYLSIDQDINNDFLDDAMEIFGKITWISLSLNKIDNQHPFENAYLWVNGNRLANLWSWYEHFFSIIYNCCLAEQSKKNLIILIDEPELHLHPSLQERFINFIFEISDKYQIIITTHSPLFIKQLKKAWCKKEAINILKKNWWTIELTSEADHKLWYLSANEINYTAFELATEEYHNELYEKILIDYYASIWEDNPVKFSIKRFDNEYFVQTKNLTVAHPWYDTPNQITLHTHIRNQIHHRATIWSPAYAELLESINYLRTCL